MQSRKSWDAPVERWEAACLERGEEETRSGRVKEDTWQCAFCLAANDGESAQCTLCVRAKGSVWDGTTGGHAPNPLA